MSSIADSVEFIAVAAAQGKFLEDVRQLIAEVRRFENEIERLTRELAEAKATIDSLVSEGYKDARQAINALEDEVNDFGGRNAHNTAFEEAVKVAKHYMTAEIERLTRELAEAKAELANVSLKYYKDMVRANADGIEEAAKVAKHYKDKALTIEAKKAATYIETTIRALVKP